MAHRSYPSPDGKSVLVVEMHRDHVCWPCRLVPMDGTSRGRQVGPPDAACTFAAWSPDGKWMYFTSDAGEGLNHIWRERFPDGEPQQTTAGPTEEEGIAIAPDGRSFVTAVALENVSVWIHDARGERQISQEGNATEPKFTPDGKKLCYRIGKKAANFSNLSKCLVKCGSRTWNPDAQPHWLWLSGPRLMTFPQMDGRWCWRRRTVKGSRGYGSLRLNGKSRRSRSPNLEGTTAKIRG